MSLSCLAVKWLKFISGDLLRLPEWDIYKITDSTVRKIKVRTGLLGYFSGSTISQGQTPGPKVQDRCQLRPLGCQLTDTGHLGRNLCWISLRKWEQYFLNFIQGCMHMHERIYVI